MHLFDLPNNPYSLNYVSLPRMAVCDTTMANRDTMLIPVHFTSSDDHVAVGEHRCKKRRMVAHRTVGYRLHRNRYIRA